LRRRRRRRRFPPGRERRRVAASFARAELRGARFFEKAFDTSRRLPYIAARRRRIRVRAEARPRGSRANSSSSLLRRKAGAERFARLRGASWTRLSTMAIHCGACVAGASSGSGVSASTAI
jgi:hypothetical protein